MDEWRKIAIADLDEMTHLLYDDDFSAGDLCDRLVCLLEYLKVDPNAVLAQSIEINHEN
jgi:uncharacterized protein YgfB (UPF0149 family)